MVTESAFRVFRIIFVIVIRVIGYIYSIVIAWVSAVGGWFGGGFGLLFVFDVFSFARFF